jgi:hypothetical protein
VRVQLAPEGQWRVWCDATDEKGKIYLYADEASPVEQIVFSGPGIYPFQFTLNSTTGKIEGTGPGVSAADVVLSLAYTNIKEDVAKVRFYVRVDGAMKKELTVTTTMLSPTVFLGVIPIMNAASHMNRTGNWQVTLPKEAAGSWVVECAAFRPNDPDTNPFFVSGGSKTLAVTAGPPVKFAFTLTENPHQAVPA